VKRRLLAIPIVILVGLAMGLAYWQAQPAQQAQAVRVSLYIYKNGELTYYDPDDPATENLAKMLLLMLDDSYSATFKPVDMNGQSYSGYYENYDDLKGVIVFGNDPTASRGSYTLSQVYYMTLPDEYDYISNQTGVYIIVGGTWTVPATATQNYTLATVALGTGNVEGSPGDGTGRASDPGKGGTILLFIDQLSQPIEVHPGDTVHVRYVISFP